MSSRLETAFAAYARLVESRLGPPPKRPKEKFSLIANPITRMRELVGQLEEEAAFEDLVTATREAFSERDSKTTGRSIWQHAVRNCLRRSGFYFTSSRSRRAHLE